MSSSSSAPTPALDLKTRIVEILKEVARPLSADAIRARMGTAATCGQINAILYAYSQEFVVAQRGGKSETIPFWALAPEKREGRPVMSTADGKIEISFHGVGGLPENVGKTAVEVVKLNPSVEWKFADTEDGKTASTAVEAYRQD